MSAWATIGRAVVRCTSACFLFVFASVVGAHFGTLGGYVLALVTGEWTWASHLRCAGWSLFAAGAVIGGLTGHARFGSEGSRWKKEEVPSDAEPAKPGRRVKVEGRLKSLLVAPLVGAGMGLIVGGMAGGFLVAIYFCAALSPFGPGGWWPILPLSYHSTGDGFSTKDPWLLLPLLTTIGAFVIAGALIGMFTTVTVGKRRYEVFPSRRAR